MSLSVDTMRKVDRMAGIPLCALATPLIKLADRLRASRRKTARPRRVLFIELSEMGSAILVDPAMRLAMDKGVQIYFLIFKSNAQSLSLLKTVPKANILTIDASSLYTLARDTLKFLAAARRLQIDTVIDLELFSRFTALLTGLSGAQRRVGYHIFHGEGLWRGDMLTRKVHYNPHIHIAKNFVSLVHATFSETVEVPFSKVHIAGQSTELAQAEVSEDEKLQMQQKITGWAQQNNQSFLAGKTPLLLVNPNASELLVQRRWPKYLFAELIDRLAERWPDALILITGSPAEFDYADDVRLMSKTPRALNFAGQVTFAELPALYSVSDVMVTNDSGPGHFAAVTPLKTVVLFGPETPALYGALGGRSIAVTAELACSPCVSAANHRKTACTDNVCMRAITVEQVMTAVQTHLKDI
ncbi:glycosyltransferase family 9 protein [Orrella marina]|uniref:Glycosyltransferase family 9 protein n=1 Tax=Orrella marina TaxID=2163011 RepID=A0A2R4XNJ9_9BURK|nr:glycosyltransferase family 9 protein [Orrella marina]AWB35390.1 glycosyltransferase family 9 protein [Orrella marina]